MECSFEFFEVEDEVPESEVGLLLLLLLELLLVLEGGLGGWSWRAFVALC
jgi:hypothetical protein